MANIKKVLRRSKAKLTSSILKATRTSLNLLRETLGQSSASHSRFLVDASSGRSSNETNENRPGSHLTTPSTDQYARQRMLDHLDGSYEDGWSTANHSGMTSPIRSDIAGANSPRPSRRRVVIIAGPHAPGLPSPSPDTPAPLVRISASVYAETVKSSSIPSDLASPNLADSPRSLTGSPRRPSGLMQRQNRGWVRNRVSAPSLIVYAQEPAYYLPPPNIIETTNDSEADEAPAPELANEAGKTPAHHSQPSVSNSVQAQFFAAHPPETRDAATQTAPRTYRDQGTQPSPPPSPRYLSSGGSSADTFGELAPIPRNINRRPRKFVRCIGRGIDQNVSPPPQPNVALVVRFPPAQSESVPVEPISSSEGELSAGRPIILLSPPESEATPSLIRDITDEAPSSNRPWDDTDFQQFENDNNQRLVRIGSEQWAVQPPQPTANAANAAPAAASAVSESPPAARWSEDYDEFSSVDNHHIIRVGELEWRLQSENDQSADRLLDNTPSFVSARDEILRRRSRPHARQTRVSAAAPVTPVQAPAPAPVPGEQIDLGPHGLNYLTPHQVLLPGETRGEWDSPQHDHATEDHPFAAVQRLNQAVNFAAQQLGQLYREREAYRHNNNVNCWKVNRLQEELTRRHQLQPGSASSCEIARLNQQLGEREAENRFLRIRLDQIQREQARFASAQADEDSSVRPGGASSEFGATVIHHQPRPSRQQFEDEFEDEDLYGAAPKPQRPADDAEQVVPGHDSESLPRDDDQLYQHATGGQVYESDEDEEIDEQIYQPESEDADVEDNSTDTEPFPPFPYDS